MKRTLLLSTFFFLFHSLTFSQTSGTPNGLLSNYDPPSPEASALGKFVDHPVGNFTGTPEIDIPLFEIKVGRIDVPISLSYHGSGVKVNDVSSRVGAGWVLNAGGMITRTVKDLPDDGQNTIFGPAPTKYVDYFHGGGSSTKSVTYSNNEPTIYDLEPDEYFYNFGNRMGKMYFINTIHPILVNDDPLVVTGPFNGQNNFVINDENGLIYTFQNAETSSITNVTTTSMGYNYQSSWFLTSIYDPISNQTVSFQYRTDIPTLTYNYPKSFSSDAPCSLNPYLSTTTVQITQSAVLSKIVYSNGYIEFDANLKRSDLTGDLAYTKISQYATVNGVSTLTKAYNMGHSFTATGMNIPQEGYRLYLDTVQQIGSDGSLMPPYLFYYNSRSSLPARNSLQQDIWGYYNANGATPNSNGTAQYPTVYIHNYGNQTDYLPFDNPGDPAKTVISGINCSSNATTASYGALTKIVYPTGGYTTYSYELNQFGTSQYGPFSGAGIRINLINDYESSGQLLLSKSYTYGQGYLGGPYPQVAYPITGGKYVQFSLNQTVLGSDQGSYVGYANVTVTQNGTSGTSNGSVNYTYTTNPDVPGVFSVNTNNCSDISSLSYIQAETYFPFFEMQSREEQRGELTQEMYYDANQNRRKSIVYNYTLVSNPIMQVNSSFIQTLPDANGNIQIMADLSQTRSINAEKMLLTSKTENDWPSQSAPANPAIAKSTTYSYCGGTNSDQFIRNETLSVNGSIPNPQSPGNNMPIQSTATINYYPFDFGSSASGGVMNDMVAMNYVSPVINQVKTITYNSGPNTGSYYISSEVHDYMLNPNASSTTVPFTYQIVPKQIFMLNSSDPVLYTNAVIADPSSPGSLYERRVSFNNYDTQSNLLDVTQDNGPHISYQWGYNSTLPTAKVVNAQNMRIVTNISQNTTSGNKDFFYDSFEEGDGTGAAGLAKTGLYSYSGTYKTTLSNLDNGQYILSYWQYISNVWVAETAAVTVSANTYSISINAVTYPIDDVRFYPAAAQMTLFTYDPLLRLEATTDPGNKIRAFQYDPFSRLLNVSDNNNNVLTHQTYHFQGQ